jgi:hypothetical protein
MTPWLDWSTTGAAIGTLLAAGVAMWIAYQVGRLHALAAERAEASARKSEVAD